MFLRVLCLWFELFLSSTKLPPNAIVQIRLPTSPPQRVQGLVQYYSYVFFYESFIHPSLSTREIRFSSDIRSPYKYQVWCTVIRNSVHLYASWTGSSLYEPRLQYFNQGQLTTWFSTWPFYNTPLPYPWVYLHIASWSSLDAINFSWVAVIS